MDTARIFTNGRSQAVRLPKQYRFPGDEVYIKKTSAGVLLMAKEQRPWEVWEQNLRQYEEPLLEERNQPQGNQERAALDDISP